MATKARIVRGGGVVGARYIYNELDAVKELNKIKGHKNWVVPRKWTKSYKLA